MPLTYVPFDERFREASWEWLNDPELHALIDAPPLSRTGHDTWYEGLDGREDYRVWGVEADGEPVGVWGLKRLTEGDAEYWGYLGERALWGQGLGQQLLAWADEEARRRGLQRLYLVVRRDNPRAVRAYEKAGYACYAQTEVVYQMEKNL